MQDQQRELCAILRSSPLLMEVLGIARAAALPDWRLVSGAVWQTVWNARTGRSLDYGIKDFDLSYFDGRDLSWDAEDVEIRRVAALAPPELRARIEVRNQARVHLWFPERFGEPYAPLSSTDQSLTRFVAAVHTVAVRLEADDTISVAAPFGLEDVFAMRMRPNPARVLSIHWDAAVASARGRWPEVEVVPAVVPMANRD
ncbi:nucleotidyltransferase family protein [Zavarzinia sp. CC-PAN008]|uniref:nucleotidyltransferase family protein n=1 Tax=Zavarzinia sp. CC-PAN008 TaxID=3243332 RepID=UPI003F747112